MMPTYFTLLPWDKVQIVQQVSENYFTLLPWDKIQIVQEVPENYFDKEEE